MNRLHPVPGRQIQNMGLDTNGVKFLLSGHRNGIRLGKTLMIGRQILNLDFDELKTNLKGFGKYVSDEQVTGFLTGNAGYAESFLSFLGAAEVDSLDYSPYEGANILHDMNLPLGEEWNESFDTVLESGSLEHIFNFPVAISNCMRMVKAGGIFLIITPVNNIMGHGFYQFSPEVFYRVLNEKNGFAIEQMLLFEYSPEEKWFTVRDPRDVGQRVELMNSSATYLCLRARRVKALPVLAQYPQQSDYEDAWEGRENYYSRTAQDRDDLAHPRVKDESRKVIKKFLPQFVLDVYRAFVQARKERFNPKFYTETDIWKL
jgi:SAM-dependent methyltransferase